VNLVGHVAVALPHQPAARPSTEFLVGCMLPDLAAIARVRLTRPDGELGRGVTFHHACDGAFHESEWFRRVNRELRDALLDAGVSTGAARACSHAGSEMLLDGALVTDPHVESCAQLTLAAVDERADALATLAPPESRAVLAERFRMIGSSLEPRRYADARFVAERLQRMTAGRRRIELDPRDVDAVTVVLDEFAPGIAGAAPDVVATVRREVPSPHRPG
jgi:hypothetical protein